MLSTMKLTALAYLATITSVSAQTSTSTPFQFALRTNSLDGGPIKDGWLSSFHVGAGQSTIVLSQNASDASLFTLQDGVLVEQASFPFVVTFLDQRPYRSDAPENYKYVAMNIGSPENGTSREWEYNNGPATLYYKAKDFTLSVCNVNGTSPYSSLGPESQLLWRSLSSAGDERYPPRCADVGLDVYRTPA